eukprot:CAMPEP_0203846856 /NCGR_PEP_ID=MMETSP0359-20131031/4680_1 /ASSEMBLY_ACC=CAM_ASM_000338 /TAXON_ID=268821 /ORGANISM="Scrippsiella Hangoei, Strain SHTV-5" /LENGTH=188 /DNA_ID=CAMNT_0050762245 /DNA_START=141 /DNA_END=709 /DNA_ORIENTATION=-
MKNCRSMQATAWNSCYAQLAYSAECQNLWVCVSAASARFLARLDNPPQHACTPLEGLNRHEGPYRLPLPAHRAPQGAVALCQPPLINALDVVGMFAGKDPASLRRFLALKADDARLVLSVGQVIRVDHTSLHVLLFGHGLRRAHVLEVRSEGILRHMVVCNLRVVSGGELLMPMFMQNATDAAVANKK